MARPSYHILLLHPFLLHKQSSESWVKLPYLESWKLLSLGRIPSQHPPGLNANRKPCTWFWTSSSGKLGSPASSLLRHWFHNTKTLDRKIKGGGTLMLEFGSSSSSSSSSSPSPSSSSKEHMYILHVTHDIFRPFPTSSLYSVKGFFWPVTAQTAIPMWAAYQNDEGPPPINLMQILDFNRKQAVVWGSSFSDTGPKTENTERTLIAECFFSKVKCTYYGYTNESWKPRSPTLKKWPNKNRDDFLSVRCQK